MSKYVPRPKPVTKPLAVKKPNEDGCLRFSFKYLHIPSDGKFSIGDRDAAYYLVLLDRLKSVSSHQCGAFRSGATGGLRNHPIRFGDDKSLTEDGFNCLNATLREEIEQAAFQFSLSTHEHGRVHGFMISDVFFVVWLDPRHELDCRS